MAQARLSVPSSFPQASWPPSHPSPQPGLRHRLVDSRCGPATQTQWAQGLAVTRLVSYWRKKKALFIFKWHGVANGLWEAPQHA